MSFSESFFFKSWWTSIVPPQHDDFFTCESKKPIPVTIGAPLAANNVRACKTIVAIISSDIYSTLKIDYYGRMPSLESITDSASSFFWFTYFTTSFPTNVPTAAAVKPPAFS